MPLRHKSAQKRARQTVIRTERNKKYKSAIKSSLKKIDTVKDKSSADAELKKTVALLDKAANKNIIHRNKAARLKSKITKKVNTLT